LRVPPDPIVFFVDRSLGRHLVPNALRRLGAVVEVHDDHFGRDTEDAEWITEVAGRGWVILTKDQRIRHRPLERSAVATAKARMFALTSGNLSGPEMAAIFSKHLERMTRISRSESSPFIARVTATGIHVEHPRP
jgi:predicted nuclease of predicted toxin-antitoxin system